MQSRTRCQGETSTNPSAEPDEPDALGNVEPDLTREVADPKMNARAHLEGAESETLIDTEGDWLLEEGIAGENANVKEES